MVRRPDEETPEPPSDRAMERLREFHQARQPKAEAAEEEKADNESDEEQSSAEDSQ